MVKADRQLRLEAWNKAVGLFIPERSLFAVSKANDHGLIWKRYWSCPMDSQCPEVCHRSDTGSRCFFRQALFLCSLQEPFVLGRQFRQWLFIEVREDRNDDPVFDFDSNAN